MRLFVTFTLAAMAGAWVFHGWWPVPVVAFICSGAALILLSKLLGDATDHLSDQLGAQFAGLLNVTLGNLAEMIIIFVAVRSGLIHLVQAGIVGSIMGNLLLVLGSAMYVGCRKQGSLSFNRQTAMLYLNMLFLVCATLMLPTLFREHISPANIRPLSYVLAIMLVGSYVYFYRLSFTDPRFKEIKQQHAELNNGWPIHVSAGVLAVSAIGAFLMSEILVSEVEVFSRQFKLSEMFIGFIVLPLLGNVAERSVVLQAARKRKTELSMAIAIGSASQVGMIVAPMAVLFGFMTGHPVTLLFANLPLAALLLSFAACYLALRDEQWNVNEGMMLIALYLALVIAFFFCT